MSHSHDRLHRETHLSPTEVEEVENRLLLRPVAVYEVVREEGEEELERPVSSLWWSGLAAGVSIGFSLACEGILHAHLPDAPWRHLLESWGYTVGFLIVILARQQLFTESTLTVVLPILAEPSRARLRRGATVWGVVLAANMVGTAIFAGAIAVGGLFPAEFAEGMRAIARHLMADDASTLFWRAIVSGWLVATVVWLIPTAEAAAFFVIAMVTYLIAVLGLTHVVAGAVDVFLLVFDGEIGIGRAVTGFFLPTLAGNVIGGSALFALLTYAQVREEIEEDATLPQASAPGAGKDHA